MLFHELDLGSRLVDYHEGWDTQRRVHASVAAGSAPPTILFVEHQAVYTAGRRTHRAERPADGTPVVDVDRGGKITWHGPGQLVAYPILPLPEPIDVVAYVRTLEDAVMEVCTVLSVATTRIEGRSGVWCLADGTQRARKICAIGVRVARGVTMHGLALNCDPDLSEFSAIVPCGITDADVTSLSAEAGHPIRVTDAAPLLRTALSTHFQSLVKPVS